MSSIFFMILYIYIKSKPCLLKGMSRAAQRSMLLRALPSHILNVSTDGDIPLSPKEPLSVTKNTLCKKVSLYQIGISHVPVLSLASCSFTVHLWRDICSIFSTPSAQLVVDSNRPWGLLFYRLKKIPVLSLCVSICTVPKEYMSNTFHQGIDFEIKSWQNPFLRVFISEVHK